MNNRRPDEHPTRSTVPTVLLGLCAVLLAVTAAVALNGPGDAVDPAGIVAGEQGPMAGRSPSGASFPGAPQTSPEQGSVTPSLASIPPWVLGSLPNQPKAAPAYPRLDDGLNRALDADDPLAEAERLGYRVREGRVQVYVVCEEGELDGVRAWLEDNGALFVSSAYDIVQAHVAPEVLRLLDTLPAVVAVRMPTYLVADPLPPASAAQDKVQTGNYVTEGLAAMNGPAWHAAGFAGQGMKVGVIDMGFGDYQSLRGTELPSTISYWPCPGCQLIPGDNHGTACAEIIMDIVSQASLYLAQVQTTQDILDAAQWLRAQGVNVISESLGYVKGPCDGTGTQQSEIAAFSNAGGLWAVSAGNYRQQHWQGHWVDANANGLIAILLT